MESRIAELAKQVTNVMFRYDPYNGADRDDVQWAIYDKMKSSDGSLDIIEMLTETLEEMLDNA
jgi:hypothetical protein